MEADWNKAILERVIHYRLFWASSHFCVVFILATCNRRKVWDHRWRICLPMCTCRERWDSPASCLQVALWYAQPITAPELFI